MLFEDDNAELGNRITLSRSAADFKRLKIFYSSDPSGGRVWQSVEVVNPNGKKVLLFVLEFSNAEKMWSKSRNIVINGTSITGFAQTKYLEGYSDGSTQSFGAVIAITRVEGYPF